MKPLSIYLDTSIISYLFADDEPEKKAITTELFEKHLVHYDVAVSRVVLKELGRATNADLRARLLAAPEQYGLNVVQLTEVEEEEGSTRANAYMKAEAIPPAKRDDASSVISCV